MTAVQDPDVEAIYELAPLQEGMLIDSLIASGADLYLEQIVMALPGRISMPDMARAWRRVVERHAILRTSFHWRDLERPLQVVHRSADLPVSFIDLMTVPQERRDAAMQMYVGRDREQGLNLERPPLLRVAILRHGPVRHDLLVTLHHAVLDGWSTTIVMEEVSQLYRSFQAGTPWRLDEARPYRDYVEWIGSQDDVASERYWRDLLGDYSGASPVGRLGTKPGVHRGAPVGGVVVRSLAPVLAGRLQRIARRLRITLNTLVLGAWAIVLGRHLGTDDLVVGAVVSGRDTPLRGVETMVGLLINTVPVRARFDVRAPVGSWLSELHAQQLRTRDHQHCSLTNVHGWSGVRRGDALFDSIFVFENHVGRSASPVAAQAFERTGYPLTVLVGVAPDVTIKLLPDAAVVTGEVVERLLDHLVQVLGAIADDPERPIGRLELMSSVEREAVGEMGRGRATALPEVPVHELFAGRAGLVGDGVALVVGGERVSFGELEGRASELAGCLGGLGVGRGDVVGLCVPRGVWWVTAMLAVWKAGGAWLALEPDVPAARLAFMAEDAGVVAVLTTEACRRFAPVHDCTVVLDGEWPVVSPVGSVPVVGGGDAAWVLYTSGSSGVPKGVVGSHGGLVNRLWWGWRVAPFGVGEVACAKTRAGFVDAVWEVFGPLVAGVPVVVVDEVTAGDPVGLADVVVGEGVTRLVGVPSLLSVLFEVAGERLRGSRLVEVTVSGEALSGELVRRIRSVVPGCRVVNLYGSTEVAGDATGFVVPDGWVGERVPIGRPLDNVWVQVVGAAGEVVPVGVVGELVVGGAAVALGYVGREELSAERFVADRWSGSAGRVYRTGDLGRWRSDGVLEFVGRADRQVKVRGVRVEPGEVEAALMAHPSVVEAAVVARPAPGGGVELVGFVVLAGEGAAVDGVRGWLRSRLVEQMVPAHLVVMAALPKLANGKLDRDALAGRGDTGARDHDYQPPRGPGEDAVAGVFAALTGADRVGRLDDFFADLGGHSLLATRAVSRLREPFGRDIPLRLLFEHPTVADLAHAITTLTPTDDTLDTITPLDRHHYRTP